MSTFTVRNIVTIVFLILAAFVLTTSVAAQGRPYSVVLSGASEVPGPGDPDGSGITDITLNQGQSTLCYDIFAEDITLPATGAHVHEAPVGDSGDILITLTPPDADGTSSGCVENVGKELIKEIRQNPENYYINVHTPDFPTGAIRGQFEK